MQWPLTQRGVGCVVLCVFSEVVPIMCEPKAACYCTSTVLYICIGWILE